MKVNSKLNISEINTIINTIFEITSYYWGNNISVFLSLAYFEQWTKKIHILAIDRITISLLSLLLLPIVKSLITLTYDLKSIRNTEFYFTWVLHFKLTKEALGIKCGTEMKALIYVNIQLYDKK